MARVDGYLDTVSTKYFTYVKEMRRFVTEASDIKHARICRRIYNDAYDEGFWLESAETGKKVLFTYEGLETDDEGDITCWNFTALSNNNPENLRDLTLVVFND